MNFHNKLNQYQIIVDWFTEIPGHKFPIWDKRDFYAKDKGVLNYLISLNDIKPIDICELIEWVDASDLGGKLGEMANCFDPRDN